MVKEVNKKNNKIFKLNTVVIITTLITLVLGIVDMTLDILHTANSPLAVAFLVLGIVMSLPGLAWIIISIIMLVKDKANKFIGKKEKIATIVILAVAIITFIPLWIEGFIDGNAQPMFNRLLYRQVIWMLVWIVYLLTNVGMFFVAYTNKCKYLYSK